MDILEQCDLVRDSSDTQYLDWVRESEAPEHRFEKVDLVVNLEDNSLVVAQMKAEMSHA